MSPNRFYGTDLAFIHDEGFTQFARDAGKGLANILRSIPDKHIVELGCGSGRMAKTLLQGGFTVSGVDVSPAMIGIARSIAPRARFTVGSLWNYTIPECGAVVSAGEVLNYTVGGKASSRRLHSLFRRAHTALLPSGAFVFDILTARKTDNTIHTRHFTEGRDWMVAVEKTDRPRSITRRIVIFRRTDGGYRRSEEVHTARRWDVDLVMALMRGVGFAVKTRRGYLDRPLGEGHIVVVGIKRNPRNNRH
jgi:SAM-dependent methyltransferase